LASQKSRAKYTNVKDFLDLWGIHWYSLALPLSASQYGNLCSTYTPIMEPCRARDMSDTRVLCIFKNFYVSVCRVHIGVVVCVQHRWERLPIMEI